jgi:CRP/FNR family cyclic AMP-dependent transcriptional regulator
LSGPKNLKKGDLLFRENDPSDSMYVIKSGRLAVTKSKGESEIVLAELGPGDMIGEMAFFDNKPRSAGARALQDTVVIELPFKSLHGQFKTFPEWLKAIVRTVNNHLRNANKKIKELEKSSEEEKQFFTPHMIVRLLAILCAVAERYGEPDAAEGGISVPPGTLRRWTIQVFQLPTNKMQKLNEVLQALGHMKMEELGEGRMKIVVKNLDLLFDLTDYYTDFLFKDEAKRVGLDEKEMKIARGMIFYADKTPPNDKGKIKINLTQIQQDSMRDLGFVLYVDDVNSLITKGLLSDKMSEDGKLMVFAELEELKKQYPYWEILHALKSVPTRE